jgi:F0F1-type ATP synthase membrane subunit c/vacuolar-type H+-ATPase subunit K
MLNKLKKTISIAKFNRAQDKRFAGVLDQNFDLENNAALLKASILVGLVAASCGWLIAISLDAQAGKINKKLEKQQFYKITQSTYNQ